MGIDMSNNRIKSLLAELADDALSGEFSPSRASSGPLDSYQKDAIVAIHEEYTSLIKQGVNNPKYGNINPTIEKRLYNQTISSFIHHPDGTTFENHDKVAAGREYLSLFKSKSEPATTAPSAAPASPSPSTKKSK
jgi:hypothetical protein